MAKACKRVFGSTICKVKSGQIITIPTAKKYGIPLTVYTSKKIKEGQNVKNRLEKINKRLNYPFSIKELDVESNPTPDEVMTLPAILIGNEIITDMNFTTETLLQKASRFSPRKEF